MQIDEQKQKISAAIRGYYDFQKLRIATGNRLVASFRGDDPKLSEVNKVAKANKEDENESGEEKVDAEVIALLNDLVKEYIEITKAIDEMHKRPSKVIASLSNLRYVCNEVDYNLIAAYADLLAAEDRLNKVVKTAVEAHPMWDAFFSEVKGCGPLMAGVCLTYFDPYVARYPSSFWKYAGLDVVYDEEKGVGVGRAKWHVETRTYIDKDGNEKEKRGITYNPLLKAKLLGVLATSFLRVRSDGKYKAMYYEYKNRLENRADLQEASKVKIHRMSLRYIVKAFLADMWREWRTLEGLPVGPSYAEAYLKRPPHHDPRNQPVGAMELS